MNRVTVGIEVPFYLRLENPLVVAYDALCGQPRVQELEGNAIRIMFSAVNRNTDMSFRLWPRTRVTIEVETPQALSDESLGCFAVRDCLRILNRVITSYQGATGEVANSGYISPLGISDMQLFADIRLNGEDVRDRWPSQSVNTFSLPEGVVQQFQSYLQGAQLPLPTLLRTNAALLLERGQYSLSIVQAATAVELRLTQYIVQRLKEAGTAPKSITQYEEKTLGQKLHITEPDPRSLETHFLGVRDFPGLYARLKGPLNRLRVEVVHHGHLASLEEARDVAEITRDFLRLVAG